jgi:hypothetical protein
VIFRGEKIWIHRGVFYGGGCVGGEEGLISKPGLHFVCLHEQRRLLAPTFGASPKEAKVSIRALT